MCCILKPGKILSYTFIRLLLFTLLLSSCKRYNEQITEYSKLFGGRLSDHGASICPARAGGFVVAGTTSSNNGDVTGNHGNSDVWIIKLNANGGIEWQKVFGGSLYDSAFAIAPASDGGYVVAGSSNSSDGDVSGVLSSQQGINMWVFKIDSLGQLVWQKTFGGSSLDAASGVAETTDGGFVVAGYTYSPAGSGNVTTSWGSGDAWVLKLSGVGNLLWQRSLGGALNDQVFSVVATGDGGAATAGYTRSIDKSGNLGLYDMWVVRLKQNGDSAWARTIGGSGDDFAYSLSITTDSGFVVAGSTSSKDGNIDGNIYDVSGKTSDLCISKINSTGKLIWIKTMGGSGNDVASSVLASPDGTLFIAGRTASSNGDVTVSRGNFDGWVLKLDSKGNKIWEQSVGGSGIDAAFGISSIPRKGHVIVGTTSSNNGDFPFNRGGDDVFVATFKNDY